jgi:hypothetical protein
MLSSVSDVKAIRLVATNKCKFRVWYSDTGVEPQRHSPFGRLIARRPFLDLAQHGFPTCFLPMNSWSGQGLAEIIIDWIHSLYLQIINIRMGNCSKDEFCFLVKHIIQRTTSKSIESGQKPCTLVFKSSLDCF